MFLVRRPKNTLISFYHNMEGITPDQLMAMKGKSTSPKEGISPQELMSMKGQSGLDVYNRNTRNPGLSPIAPETTDMSNDTITGIGVVDAPIKFLSNFGAGTAKRLYGAADSLLTLGNELTGFSDDPNFKFGTESRKDKVQRLFKPQTVAGKIGGTAVDVAALAAPGGISQNVGRVAGPITQGIRESRPITNLILSNSRLANFLGKTLPTVPQNILEGAALAGFRNDEYNTKNAAFDTGAAIVAPIALKTLARLIPGGSEAVTKMNYDEMTQIYDDIYKRAEQSGDTQTLNRFNDYVKGQVTKVADNISNLKPLKGILSKSEEFTRLAEEDANSIAKNFGEFTVLRVGPKLDEGFIKGNNLTTADYSKALDEVTKQEMDAVRGMISGADNRFNVSQVTRDALEDTMKYDTTADALPLGVDRKVQDFLNRYQRTGSLKILSMPVYEIAQEAGVDPAVARGIKNAVMASLESKIGVYGDNAVQMIRDSLKNLQYSAISKSILRKMDGSVVGNDFVSRKLFSNMMAALSTAGTANPAVYFPANYASGKLYDLLSGITGRSKLNRRSLFASARKNNIGDINVYQNKISEMEEAGKKIQRTKEEQAFFRKRDADKARGQKEAVRRATKKQADYDKWLQKQLDTMQSEEAGVPIPPKDIINEAKTALDDSIDTAKEVQKEIKMIARQKGMSEQDVIMDIYADIARQKREIYQIKATAPREYYGEIDADIERLDRQIELLRSYNELPQLKEKRKLFGRRRS